MRKLNYFLLIVLFNAITTGLNAQVWTQIGSDISGEDYYDNSGYSVSLSSDGSIVAIGAPYSHGSSSAIGQVKVLKKQSDNWVQIADAIYGEASSDRSGYCVSLSSDGSIVAIGAPFNDGNGSDAGHVRIYENQSGNWIQIGDDIDGESEGDNSGYSVSLSSDGTILAIGAPLNNGTGNHSGHVRIYENQSGNWIQIGNSLDGEAANNFSGWSVSLNSNGSLVAIGAYLNDGSGENDGHVRVYENNSNVWSQVGNDINGERSHDWSGYSVSLSGDGTTVAVGAIYNDDGSDGAGHVRIYENNIGQWIQLGEDIDGKAAKNFLGHSVCLSYDGSYLAAGGPASYNYSYSGFTSINSCNSFITIDTLTCNSYTNPSGDETYSVSGVYYDTIPNSIGRDSIITINLTIGNNSGIDKISACDSYTWIDGKIYTSSNNTATHTLTNINGCDSVVTLDLTLNYSNSGTDVITACDSYTWIDGNTYTSNNNTATHTLTNANGCDSVATLDLTINYSNSGTDVITACDSYTWIDGNTYTSINNTATHTLTNVNGCDSVVTLDLTIANNTGTDIIAACDSYTWIDENTYTSSNNTATHTLTNVNGCDSVVSLDLTINYSNTAKDVITACDSYTWIDGNTYTSSNNTANHILTNVNGCDSIITLDLTINTVDVSVTENGFNLTANESGASYQWIDCNNNNNPITGKTSQSFTATENGSYAVIVDNGFCVATSTCYAITGVGINDFRNVSINIYPNPTNGIIEIDLANNKINKISIVDISGRKIIEKVQLNRNEKLDLSDFGSGLYIIMFETDKKHYISKIIKE